MPDDLMVLDGNFAVKQENGNKFLELAGDPIGSFGALFGPDGVTSVDVKARIWAASKGQRFPEFGIGADDVSGFKLILAPGTGTLEVRKGDDARASVRAAWSSGQWTWFRLRVSHSAQNAWQIEGKTWADGKKEPDRWSVHFEDKEAPSAGNASIWASDYSEQPVRFDDLRVTPLSAGS